MALKGQTPDNPMRLYADGVFDLFHFGHGRLFEQCKKKFPFVYLIVGVAGDDDVIALKGKPLMNEFERAKSVEQCKWVDQVICPCPWVSTVDFLDQIGADYICHDDIPYVMGADETGDVYYPSKKAGRFLATQRTEGVSTSDLIIRMIQKRDTLMQLSKHKETSGFLHYKQSLKKGFKALQSL
jgi:choline-phosphate cytidylyltransferase